ncbi:hypothetical protein Barb6XT_02275 [Bacteroidales bacterium Barb6XT]|nr:hypothetical protein Barb6XT_02275 [Bacteroidales bacterium Barb6XT]
MLVRSIAAGSDAKSGVGGFPRHPAPGVIRAAFHCLPRRVGYGNYGAEKVAGNGIYSLPSFLLEKNERGMVGIAAEVEAFGNAGGRGVTFIAAKVGADGQKVFRRIRCQSVSAHADAVVSGVVPESDAAVSSLDFKRSLRGGIDKVKVIDGRSLLDVRNGVGFAGRFIAIGTRYVGLGKDIAVRVVGHRVHTACRCIAVGSQAFEVVVGIGVCFPCPVVGLGEEIAGKSVEIVGDVHDSCGRPPDGDACWGIFVGTKPAADSGGSGMSEGVGFVQPENGCAVPELLDDLTE